MSPITITLSRHGSVATPSLVVESNQRTADLSVTPISSEHKSYAIVFNTARVFGFQRFWNPPLGKFDIQFEAVDALSQRASTTYTFDYQLRPPLDVENDKFWQRSRKDKLTICNGRACIKLAASRNRMAQLTFCRAALSPDGLCVLGSFVHAPANRGPLAFEVSLLPLESQHTAVSVVMGDGEPDVMHFKHGKSITDERIPHTPHYGGTLESDSGDGDVKNYFAIQFVSQHNDGVVARLYLSTAGAFRSLPPVPTCEWPCPDWLVTSGVSRIDLRAHGDGEIHLVDFRLAHPLESDGAVD